MKKHWYFFLLTAAFLAFTACRTGKHEEKTNTENWPAGAMMKVGDTYVSSAEGLVYLDATRQEYEQYYGTDIWNYRIRTNGDTLGITVKESVLESIIYTKVVCAKANELNVTLSSEELTRVDELAAAYMKGLEGNRILSMGVNVDVVRRIYSDNFLAKKVFERATLNVDTNISNDIAGQHHLYSIAQRSYRVGINGERIEYSEEEKAVIKERMLQMIEDSKNYKSFYSYAKDRTEDLKMLDIMVGRGDLDPSYEDKLLALNDGEYSEFIEGKDFFYVFYCDKAHDIDATQAKKEELIAVKQKEAFEQYYTEWRKDTVVSINNDVWDAMEVFTVTLEDKTEIESR